MLPGIVSFDVPGRIHAVLDGAPLGWAPPLALVAGWQRARAMLNPARPVGIGPMLRSLALGAVLSAAAAAGAAETATPEPPGTVRPLGGDVFVAGGSVGVSQPVSGDLFVSGGNVDVDAAVAGDALALGGKVRLGSSVGGSVYAAAGQLNIGAKVERNVRVVGGQVELGPKSEVGGNLSLAGGQARLEGTVRGEVRSAGGRLVIDGPVGGDVVAFNGQIQLGPHARIAGKLRYRSDEDPQLDPAALVAGGVEKLAPLSPKVGQPAAEPRRVRGGIDAASLVWTLGLIAMASVLLAALPNFSASLSATLRQRPGASALLGFVWLICLPVAAVVLVITLVGIPLALFALAFYVALMPVAYVAAGVGLGDGSLRRWRPGSAGKLPARIAAAAAALLALTLLGWLPVLGTAVGFVALVAGLGALLLQARPWLSPATT